MSQDVTPSEHLAFLSHRQRLWLSESITYFRALGFYAEGWGQTGEEVLRNIYQREKERQLTFKMRLPHHPSLESLEAGWHQWGENPLNIDIRSDIADYLLLKHDDRRMWWHDTEANVMEGNYVYARTLMEFAKMSRGALKPEQIREEWIGSTGPVVVTFVHQGRRVQFEPRVANDWLDLGTLLQVVNNEVALTLLNYETCEGGGQDVIVVALMPNEKEALMRDRGWKFCTRP